MMKKPSKPVKERGSALLIVFVFAAVVAIMLYMEMPVAVFEAQRSKEQILIDRGNEYAHGVKLYLRKVGQYPPSFDAMENTNRMRFLRKRYKDPFTGKDDWRLLHAAPNGMLIDSKVNPIGNTTGAGNSNLNANNNSSNSTVGGSNSPSSSNSTFGGFNSGGSNSTFGSSNSSSSNSTFGGFNSSSSSSTFGGFNSGSSSSTGTGGAEVVVPKIPQRAPAIAANGEGNSGSANQDPLAAAMNNAAASTAGSPPGGLVVGNTDPNALPTAANGQAPAPNTNSATPQAVGANPAAPRPNATSATGSPSLGTAFSSSSGLGTIQTGGIAGVASKADGHGIKTVNDQENYSLWEFYYDPSKDAMKTAAGALSQMGGNRGINAGQSTSSGFNSSSGSNSGTGGSSGFGNFGGGLSGMQNSSQSGFSQSQGAQNTNNSFGGFGSSGSSNSSIPSSPPTSSSTPPPQ